MTVDQTRQQRGVAESIVLTAAGAWARSCDDEPLLIFSFFNQHRAAGVSTLPVPDRAVRPPAPASRPGSDCATACAAAKNANSVPTGGYAYAPISQASQARHAPSP